MKKTKLTKENLRAIGVFNQHNALKSGEPSIHYAVPAAGRAGWCDPSGWLYMVKGRDLKNHWTLHGQAHLFDGMDRVGKNEREKVLARAAEVLGITEWERLPFDAWVPKTVADRLRKMVAEAKVNP